MHRIFAISSGWLLRLSFVAIALAGCGQRGVERAPLPPIPDVRGARLEKKEPARRIEDQPIEPTTPELGAGPGEAAEAPSTAGEAAPPPSVLASLSPAATPNEVAAARLVEEARERLAERDVDAALDRLERAIAIDATNPYAFYFLGQAHFERGTYAQALAFADRAAALGARSDASWVARSHLLRAGILEKVGRFSEARSAFRQALEADPGIPGAAEGLDRLGR